MVTSVGLYFSAKDPSVPINVQIRNVENGYPGTIVYGEKVVYPANIKVSTNGTLETKVIFDDPVYCKAEENYCFVIVSDSNLYQVYVAELGKTDLTTKTPVVKQPYTAGVMFSSSNGITWTSHNTQDMKFRIYTANFQSDGQILFNPVTDTGMDQVLVAAEYITPQGTNLDLQYRLGTDKPWLPISSYEAKDLNTSATQVELKANLKSLPNISPAIAKDTINIIGFDTKLEGYYITKNAYLEDGFKTVTQVIEAAIPAGTSVQVKFATDSLGTTWIS